MPRRRGTYLSQFVLSYPRPVATLLRANGTEYPGGTICNKIKIPHERSVVEVTERADNSVAFVEMGRRVGRSGGMILEAFSEEGVAAILADIGRARTDGLFILERPRLGRSGKGWRHWVRFFEADFEMAQETIARSVQGIQWHRATISNMEVLRSRRI